MKLVFKKKKIAVILLVVLMIFSSFSVNSIASDKASVNIFVAASGDDANDGTIENPLKTVEAAKNKVREIIKKGYPNGGINVNIREGEYYFDKAVKFSKEDSGTENCPITYKAYNGEKAVIMGGITLPTEKFSTVTDEKILNRVPIESRGKVLQISLAELGLTREIIGEQNYPGAYSQPEYQANTPAYGVPAELFSDNIPRTVARYPNNEFIKIKQVYNPGSQVEIAESGTMEVTPFEIAYEGTRPNRWNEAKDAKLYGFWAYDWGDSTVDIGVINKRKKSIKSVQAHAFGVAAAGAVGGRYYVFNLLEEIDMPGEYFIDRDNLIMYYYPTKENVSEEHLQLSLTNDVLFHFQNASNITIDGLEMTASRYIGAYINESENITISNCKIMNLGSRAVSITNGDNNGVLNCEIYNVDGGVYLSGDEGYETLTPSGNYAVNNHIYDFARLTPTYTPGVMVSGVGCYVAHNKIHGAGHLGMMLSNSYEGIVEYNEIYDVLNDTSDAGAIYWGRSFVHRNTVRYNYIHDFGADNENVGGIYLDDYKTGDTVYGNIIANSEGGVGVICGGGRELTVKNNIFVNLKYASILFNTRAQLNNDSAYIQKVMETPISNSEWSSKYPRLLTLINDEPHIPKYNQIDNNIAIECANPLIDDLVYQNSDVNDPVSVAKSQINYSFDESGKLRLNYNDINTYLPDFEKTDIDKMGLQKDFSKDDIKIDFSANVPQVELSAEERLKGAAIFALNSSDMILNSEQKPLSEITAVKPILINDSTYVPLRAIAEALGKKVFWDERGLIIISDTEYPLNLEKDSEVIEELLQQLDGHR